MDTAEIFDFLLQVEDDLFQQVLAVDLIVVQVEGDNDHWATASAKGIRAVPSGGAVQDASTHCPDEGHPLIKIKWSGLARVMQRDCGRPRNVKIAKFLQQLRDSNTV